MLQAFFLYIVAGAFGCGRWQFANSASSLQIYSVHMRQPAGVKKEKQLIFQARHRCEI
jgi:hypothetical protein